MNTHAAIGDQTVDPNEECPRCGSQPEERDATCPVCTDNAGQARLAFDLTRLTPTQCAEQAQANWAEHGECPRCGSSPGARDETCLCCTDENGTERAAPVL
jgi:hypothetical protein